MSYFYATRNDKNNNFLVTSYAKKVQADKYGGGGKIWEGERFLEDDDFTISENDSGRTVRSLMRSAERSDEMTGDFAIYGRQKADQPFEATPFRFSTYGAANTAMKSMAGMFETILVVEEEGVRETAHEPVGEDLDDSPPF